MYLIIPTIIYIISCTAIPTSSYHFCLGTEVPRHSAESVGTYVCHTLIIFITNDTALRMLEYKPCIEQYCKIGNSQCLFKFKGWFIHTTRCKFHSYTVVYTSTRCLAHGITHSGCITAKKLCLESLQGQ